MVKKHIPNTELAKLDSELAKTGNRKLSGYYTCVSCGTGHSMSIKQGHDGSLAFGCAEGCNPEELAAQAWPMIAARMPLEPSTELAVPESKEVQQWADPKNQTEFVWSIREMESGLNQGEALTLIMLNSRGNDVFPSYETIARDTFTSRKTAYRHVMSLQEKGFLTIGKKKTQSGWVNYYHVKGSVNLTLPTGQVDEGSVKMSIGFGQNDTRGSVILSSGFGQNDTQRVKGRVKREEETEEENVGPRPDGLVPPSVLSVDHDLSISDDLSFPALNSRASARENPFIPPGREELTLPDSDSALDLSVSSVDDILNIPARESEKVRFFKSDRDERYDRIYRRAGKSKARPGEKEVWLDEVQMDELGL